MLIEWIQKCTKSTCRKTAMITVARAAVDLLLYEGKYRTLNTTERSNAICELARTAYSKVPCLT